MYLKKNLPSLLIISALIATPAFAKNTDASITSSIESKFSANQNLANTSLNVSTNHGVVTLTGNVASDMQASTATELAESTPGVTDVDSSKLSINTSQHPVTDAMITAKIKGMFIQKKLFTDADIAAMAVSVETNNGVVTLSGTADNRAQASNAVKIARSIKGVKKVNSTITVNPENK